MDPMTMVTALVILAGALGFVGWPLVHPALAEGESTARERRREALDEEKERLLSGIADLEHDRQTGKMEDGDFQALTARLKGDAARILREIDVNEGRKVLRPGESPEPASPVSRPAPAEPVRAAAPVSSEKPTRSGVKPASLAESSEEGGAFCTKCGRRAKSAGDRFCGKCGSALPDDV